LLDSSYWLLIIVLLSSSIVGAVGILWFFSWIFLAYSSPATHPRISRKEKKYIESSIAESTEKQVYCTARRVYIHLACTFPHYTHEIIL